MLTASFEWSFRVNRNATLRERIGAGLRSLAIQIESTPPLSLAQKVECITFATRQLRAAIADTVKTAAEERILDVVMKEKNGSPS